MAPETANKRRRLLSARLSASECVWAERASSKRSGENDDVISFWFDHRSWPHFAVEIRAAVHFRSRAVRVGAGFEDVEAQGEAVGGGRPRMVEDLAPFRERRIGGDGDGGAFCSLGQCLEEQFGAARVEADVVELVQAEQVEPAIAGDEARELALVVGPGEVR